MQIGVCKTLDSLLVGLGRGVVLALVHLVGDGRQTSGNSVGDGVLSGNVALSLLLVGLLLCLCRLYMHQFSVRLVH